MFCSECGLVAEPGPLDARTARAQGQTKPKVPSAAQPSEEAPGPVSLNFVEISRDGFCIGAEFLAEGLGVKPGSIHTMMKFGEITSVCEKGYGEDAGRHRLTFCHGNARMRFVVNSTGRVLEHLH